MNVSMLVGQRQVSVFDLRQLQCHDGVVEVGVDYVFDD